MAYTPRVLDARLDALFPHLAAIAIEGAKGVGKTATAQRRATTVLDLTLPAERTTLLADLGSVAELPPPVLVDEWQLVPAVWDRVRRAVDDDATGGRFLLTGSAGAARDARIHSGAGRIVRLTMRPLSIAEREIETPTVSLKSLFDGDDAIKGRTSVRAGSYVDEILASGFPGIRALPLEARDAQLDSYITRILDSDLPENGVTVRRPDTLRAWLAAYGAAIATDTAYTKILNAATADDDDKPARATVTQYREHLTRLFILDPLEPWIPVFNPLKRLAKSPKHHLVDPALAARLAKISKAALLRGRGSRIGAAHDTWLGALFESLTLQSVRTYADAAGATVGHLRTEGGAREIDIIVEKGPDQVVAIEVKLAEDITDHDVRHLNWLHEQIGDRLIERIAISTGPAAYRRPDGVAVVPLALFGP